MLELNLSGRAIAPDINGEEAETLPGAPERGGRNRGAAVEGEASGGGKGYAQERRVGSTRGAT